MEGCTNKWGGPDPVSIRSRGEICAFPQDEDNPIWIPLRLTRMVKISDAGTTPDHAGMDDASDRHSSDSPMGCGKDMAGANAST